MLTTKQSELLNFIDVFLSEHDGVSPSYDEMREALNIKSKSGIHKLINELIERGFLAQIPNKARALCVLKSFKLNETDLNNDVINVKEIPLYGKIAAGVPICAINDNPNRISVCGLPKYGDFYALTVSGDSMIDAGILDGDTVIVETGVNITPNDVAVVLIDDSEVTLKFVKVFDNEVSLIPANKNYSVRNFSLDRVKFQGRVIQLIRNF